MNFALDLEPPSPSGSDGGGGGPPSFQVGMESSQERLNELQFSLVHHSAAATPSGGPLITNLSDEEEAHEEELTKEEAVKNQELIAAEIGEFAGKVLMDMDRWDYTGPPALFDEEADDDMTGLMTIHRMDSRDVVFDNRLKRAKILGHYVMGDVLGEGSYAKVKEAVDQRTLCRRAIKIMKRKKLRRIPHGEQNAEREIKLLATLRHRNVMEQVEVMYNDEKGKIYLVLEYCCAVLKDMIEESDTKRLPVWQAHFYFKQVVEGLEYLHANRIVHKDIKPGNLLLNTAGILKIADFGVAEVLDRFAPDDTCCTSQGTPAFQPPEIANGAESFPGFKIDVWSSGVTLFNFVTGDYPFNGDTIFRLFEDIARCEFKVPTDVDPVLEGLIRGMLRKDPHERYSLRDIKMDDWFRKKHPCSSPPVTVRPRNDDPALSTTVIPYLCDLHYGSQLIHEPGGAADRNGEFISEHEVKEIERRKQEAMIEPGEVVKRNGTDRKRKDKTTKCMKLRSNDCVIA